MIKKGKTDKSKTITNENPDFFYIYKNNNRKVLKL